MNHTETSAKSWSLLERAQNPSELASVPFVRRVRLTNEAGKKVFTHKQMNKFKAPYPRMRSDMKRRFSLENQEKNACASRSPDPS